MPAPAASVLQPGASSHHDSRDTSPIPILPSDGADAVVHTTHTADNDSVSSAVTESTVRQRHTDITPKKSIKSPTPSAVSSSSSSLSPSNPVLNGLTDDGERFAVPDTLNTVNTFLPQNMGLVSATTLVLLLCSAYLVLFGSLNKWYHIAWFFVWRCSYDIGLGVILSQQSQHRMVTKWYRKHRGTSTAPATTFTHQLLDHLAQSQLPRSLRPTFLQYPLAFRSWLVYKSLVNFILVQDGLNYLLLAVKVFKLPTWQDVSVLLLVQYLAGIVLSVFNLWAKQDAHRCIGSYSWYWGDFWFIKQTSLVFDGIFELFPHPMYTVGYSLYYGLSLLSRSYTLLFVSLTAHALQLAFLFFVEEPHIERTYGKLPTITSSEDLSNKAIQQLYNPASKPDAIFYSSIDITRPADIGLVLSTVYSIVLTIAVKNPYICVIHVVAWRVIHWLGLGSLLWLQSTRQWWSRKHMTTGRTLSEAYTSFKGCYNWSYTMNLVSFLLAAARFNDFQYSYLTSPSDVARMVGGLILVVLNVWSYKATLNAVGMFGWFFGDFFVLPPAATTDSSSKQSQSASGTIQRLCYTGIYRFLNNPDCITGYMGLYGTAMICKSWLIFSLALLSHGCQLGFLQLVEIPHMNRIYNNSLRSSTPAIGALAKLKNHVTERVVTESPQAAKLVNEINAAEDVIKQEIRKVRLKASKEVLTLYQTIAKRRRALERMIDKQGQPSHDSNGVMHSSDVIDEGEYLSDEEKRGPPAVEEYMEGSSIIKRRTSTSQSPAPTLAATDHLAIGDSLTVGYTTNANHSDTDWIGIYQMDVESLPSASEGRWLYVPAGAAGTVTFPSSMLPQQEGLYEIRYHRNNKYSVVTSRSIVFHLPSTEFNPLFSPTNANSMSPNTKSFFT